jgi:threonine dehydratase
VPETTPEFTRVRLRGYGAEVVVHGAQWAEANARAISIAEASNGVLVRQATNTLRTQVNIIIYEYQIKKNKN